MEMGSFKKKQELPYLEREEWFLSLSLSFFFFFFLLFRAILIAYGSFQARDGIVARDADLHHSHSHAGSETCL